MQKYDLNFFSIVTKTPSFEKSIVTKLDAEKLISKFNAVEFVKVGSKIIGGQGGGGRKDFAQAGGQDQSKIEEACKKLKELI